MRVTADNAFSLAEAYARSARSLQLSINSDSSIEQLAILLQPYCEGKGGHVLLKFCCQNEQAYGELRTPASWLINLEAQLLEKLHELLGEEAVEVHF